MSNHLLDDEADDLEFINFIENQLEEVDANVIDPDDFEYIKLIENQLEEVDANVVDPFFTSNNESDSEFIKLIEDQLDEVDNESDSEFVKLIEDQLEMAEFDSCLEMIEHDFRKPKDKILLNMSDLKTPVVKMEEDITKLPQVAQLLHDFDKFEKTMLPACETLHVLNLDDQVFKIQEDITKLPQVAELLNDFNKFESTMLPAYETDQKEIQEPSDWVLKGEELCTNDIMGNEDEFDVKMYVTEEEWQYLLGDSSNEFLQNGNLRSSSKGNGGEEANHGGGSGGDVVWEGDVASSSCVKYGFFVQVIDGVTIWRWLGSQAQNNEGEKPHGIGRSMLMPMAL